MADPITIGALRLGNMLVPVAVTFLLAVLSFDVDIWVAVLGCSSALAVTAAVRAYRLRRSG